MNARATPGTPWDDPAWREPTDTPWQAGLRALQAWWRSEVLQLPPGPFRQSDPDRLVASNLDFGAPSGANFLTPEAVEAVEARLTAGGGGLVSEDRLRRMLLSSQPMCFNAFGHFQPAGRRDALLPWVRHLALQAVEVVRVEIEWAPPPEEHFNGGSAFDAFVEYRRDDGRLGFLGIECKYHEDLAKSDVKHVRQAYIDYTEASDRWRDTATQTLNQAGTRQFWLNTLLAQSLLDTSDYAEGRCVVVACAADHSARNTYLTVRRALTRPADLTWAPWETLVDAIPPEHADWAARFRRRYLDFEPVAHVLRIGDPRLAAGTPGDLATAFAVAERVLGDGSTLGQLADAGTHDDHPIWSRLPLLVEELKRLRGDAAALLDLD